MLRYSIIIYLKKLKIKFIDKNNLRFSKNIYMHNYIIFHFEFL